MIAREVLLQPISHGMLEQSWFDTQSTIASTLVSSIQKILKEPASAIIFLAEALPAQSAYFIQVIIVQNLLPLGIELLRISPIVQNAVRKMLLNMLGRNLTEKERNQTFLGVYALRFAYTVTIFRELSFKSSPQE